jgi:putative transposase
MRKSKFSDEQIASILAEYRAGVSAAEVCRKHSVSVKTFYSWKRKFGEVNANEVRRMKDMQAQITKLERIVARQAVELEGAKELLRGKW